jgi:hypothetical protein
MQPEHVAIESLLVGPCAGRIIVPTDTPLPSATAVAPEYKPCASRCICPTGDGKELTA